MLQQESLVVLSGGQDSATCLAYALSVYTKVHTVTFDYNQKHRREIICASILSKRANVASHQTIPINSFTAIGNSALVQNKKGEGGQLNVTDKHPTNAELPASFVPGRNMVFLTLACAYAYKLNVRDVITGVCETDYSGYPDCRDQTIHAVNTAVNLAMDTTFNIITPLMYLSKKETVELMIKLGKLDWYKNTQTCYNGGADPCMECPACLLRAKGFQRAGVIDPLIGDAYA